jgi:hypothetical protein
MEPLFKFDINEDRWGIVYDVQGGICVLAKLEEGRWRWKSTTVETPELERGNITMTDFLLELLNICILRLKKEYSDMEPKTLADKLTWNIKNLFSYDGTLHLNTDGIKE